MKIYSSSKKSILDQPISLSSSLSRKLRNNGSMRRAQSSSSPSPMMLFSSSSSSSVGKKRGGNFESNPEPSSPKVTCIGQVRMKTKEQGKKMRTMSSSTFRRATNSNNGHLGLGPQGDSQRNQRWVHLPLTICEALKSFGSEFSCLSSSCFSRRQKLGAGSDRNGGNGNGNGGSCGSSVCARWLVAVQDGEGGNRREIELMVGGEDHHHEEYSTAQRSLRRHVFDEIQIGDHVNLGFNDEDNDGDEGGEGRFSICIPPKNALLLMRCRSDPIKMSTLVNRLCDPTTLTKHEDELDQNDDDDGGDGDGESDQEQVNFEKGEEKVELSYSERWVIVTDDKTSEEEEEEQLSKGELEMFDKVKEENQMQMVIKAAEEDEEIEENCLVGSCSETVVDQEHPNFEQDEPELVAEEERRMSNSSSMEASIHTEVMVEEDGAEEVELATLQKEEEEDHRSVLPQEQLKDTHHHIEKKEEEEDSSKNEVLPDCLLLMMCEPKLSMEVSKETWVCSTDFIRRPPPAKRLINNNNSAPAAAAADSNPSPAPATAINIESNPSVPQNPLQNQRPPRTSSSSIPAPAKTNSKPPVPTRRSAKQSPRNSCSFPAPEADELPKRSSCSFPTAVAGVSMAAMIEQKLVNAVGYEPLVLTRCKSAPMRTAVAAPTMHKPEPCFWKDRKIEPHRRATFGVGAAGVGC